MVREATVSYAVDFLRDPTVAAAALDKKIAFLQSKNLSQEEIDTALSRAGGDAQNSPLPHPQPQYAYQGQQMRQPVGRGYGYDPYQGGPWPQALPETPRRDWRDWFIVATVTSGVGCGLYTVAKRYVLPLIAPPTPPQLEADKSSIDASFNRAFALIDQLTADTAKLQVSETERTEKLDASLESIDNVVEDLKAADMRREAESKIIADQVRGLKDLVPRALQGWKASGDAKLEELGQEVQSLKRLLETRVSRPGIPSTPIVRGYPPPTANGNEKSRDTVSRMPPDKDSAATSSAPAPGVTAPKQDSLPPSGNVDRRVTIPAWQMAAAGNSETASSSTNVEGSPAEPGP